MKASKRVKILFVCLGNICRSPTAHGVFRELVIREGLDDIVEIDSAGTHAYHLGKPPDPRAQETAHNRGVDLSDLRARKAQPEDFEYYDYVLAMDLDNYNGLCDLCPPEYEKRIALFMDYAPQLKIREVPDPYYGGPRGFEQVFDLVEAAASGLLNDIRTRYL